MQKILLLFTVFCCTFILGQTFSWVKQFKSYTDYEDAISEMEKDDNGNIYLLGKTLGFSGIDVDPGPATNLLIPTNYYSSGTYGTTFIIKVDPNGNFLWSYKISNMHADYEYDLKVKNGKVYALTGKAVQQGNYINQYATLTILDSNGNLVNETQLTDSTPNSLDVDNSGNIYVSTFTFSDLIFSQPINSVFNNANNTASSYIIKFNSSLQVQWLKKIINGIENKLVLNSDNDVYFAMNTTYGSSKYTLQRYNSNGILLWDGIQEDQRFSDIVIDKNDKLIVSGEWMAQFLPVDVDPSSNQYLLPSNTYVSLYLLWFDKNNTLLDVKKYLNNGQHFPLYIDGLSCDDNNDLHVNGYFSKTFDANPDLGVNSIIFGSGYTEGCSIVFNPNREYKNSFRIGSTNPYKPNSGARILQTVKFNNSYYYIGTFFWHCDFDPSPNEYFLNTVNQNQLNMDGYLLRLERCNLPSNSSINICLGSAIQLNASGGTTYSWTGPNGFNSTQQNPVIPNSSTANSGIYTCQVSGTTNGCDGSFSVQVIVGDIIPPIPNTPNLPNITGDCHTTVSVIPIATDNCAGPINATTTDPLSYSLPGTYVIHWTYNDGNGNISSQNQNVIITSPALPTTVNTQQTFCKTNNPKISDLQITGQNIKWYNAAGTLLAPSTSLVNGQTYYASQTVNGCESSTISIQVTVNETPKPTGNTAQDFCASANPTLANLAVTGTALKFYDAAGNLLPLTTPLIYGATYFVTQTLNSCESENLAVSVTLSTNNVLADDYSEIMCNSTTGASMTVNLTSYQDDIIVNPGIYTFAYTDDAGNAIANPSGYSLSIGTTIIHVKVSTQDGCFKVVRLNLTLNPKPKVNLPEKVDFCNGKSVTLDAGNGYSSYLWSTGETTQSVTISAPGNYSVTVTNSFGCQNTGSVQVSYTALPEITAVNISNSTATVILSAAGSFEYSLDNFSWQDSNVFMNLPIGEYIVYVRTKGGCIIGQKRFSIFSIPNAFTPNGDGYNDHWKIAGLENYPGTEVNVYDRKGLPVFKETTTKKPMFWDGKLNGAPVPTGNYWYTIKVSDGRLYTGWLLIKNRE